MARLHAGSFLRLTTPVKLLANRFPFLLLIVVTVALIVIGRLDTSLMERLRTIVTDVSAPFIDLVSRPVVAMQGLVSEITDLAAIREKNRNLHAQVVALQQSNLMMERLAGENESLRTLLKFVPDSPVNFIAARMIADSGNAFVRSALINAGKNDGVRKGDPVVNGEGVVGRISQVGDHVSRVLLIMDWNSRIPVLVESSREKAILAGDNTNHPHLLYMPTTAVIAPGDRIVTSGHGGVFPPGLPVGTVRAVSEDEIRVQPFVTWNRLELVRVVNYGLKGVLSIEGVNGNAKGASRK